METIDEAARTVIISVNPTSGGSDRQAIAHRLADLLLARGYDAQVPGDLPTTLDLARKHHLAHTLRAVVAAGGDGTVAMLVNQLPRAAPLCILPLGTENLLAKFLLLTDNTEELCDVISEGYTVELDVGRANDKYFLVMCSCGFDADVVKRLHLARKGHISHWSYARPILDAISRYRYPTLRIRIDDEETVIKSKWAFVFNVPRYAMNLPIVSDADCQDGVLDLCTFRGGNLFRGLFYLAGVVFQQHRSWKDTNFAKFKKLTIESEEPVPFQLDGDPGGELPLKIEAVPRYLRMMVGRKWLRQHGLLVD
jgi:diacylglycerol kinase family enzyme